jgi:hypothetical protein
MVSLDRAGKKVGGKRIIWGSGLNEEAIIQTMGVSIKRERAIRKIIPGMDRKILLIR